MQQDIQYAQRRILQLRTEHRDLDYLIDKLATEPGHDELQLRRLKKRRLKIKDAITLFQLHQAPDSPA